MSNIFFCNSDYNEELMHEGKGSKSPKVESILVTILRKIIKSTIDECYTPTQYRHVGANIHRSKYFSIIKQLYTFGYI